MIGRLKWCVYCALVLFIQTVLSPAADAAGVVPSGDAKPKSASTGELRPPRLHVTQSAGRDTLAPGELGSYELTVVNRSGMAASNVRIMDMLPSGFRYKSGSVRLNGASAADPAVSEDGSALTFQVGDLPRDGSATVSFVAEATPVSKPGQAISYVSAISSGGGNSNVAMSTVLVKSRLRPNESLPEAPPAAAATKIQPVARQEVLSPAPEKSSEAVAGKAGAAAVAPPAPVSAVRPASSGKPQIPARSDADRQLSKSLHVMQSAGRDTLAPGELGSYELTVVNRSGMAASNVRIMDMLPSGFRYKSGSVRLNGASAADPAVSEDGSALTFQVGDLPRDGSATVSFVAEATPVSKPGQAISYVSAISSGGGNSNVAMTTVLLREPVSQQKEDPPGVSPPVVVPDKTPVVQKETQPASTENPAEVTAPTAGSGVIARQPALSAAQPAPQIPDPPRQPVPSIAPVTEEKPVETRAKEVIIAAESRSLTALTGTSEISVLTDLDGQFVKSMAENQILENEFAGQAGDTSILESIRAGRGFNRESRAASARTEQAKAQTGQAVALLLPSVSVRASYGSETSQPSVKADPITGKAVASDTHSRTDAALTVRQPLFDLPSFMDWRRRKVVEQVRGENYRVSDGDAYISTANAYLSLVSSRLQTDMTREFENRLAELLSYVEKRAGAGAASVSDMARVRARSQATRSSRLEQESAHAASGIEFVRLTNLVPRKVRLPEPGDLGDSLLPKSFDMAVATAMKSNPEIAALTAEIQAAEIDKSSAKGRYLPRIDAEYTDSYSLHAGGDPSSAGQRDKRIMMVLNWSLFSGGSDYYNHAERAARHKELQYRLDDQRRRVVQTLSANYATLETTKERIASGYQELKSISTAAEAMSKRMLSGNQSLLDLLDVYDRFYQVRSRLVSLHILEMSTVAQLVRITHGAPGAVSKSKVE